MNLIKHIMKSAKIKIDKANDDRYIYNPDSKRYILKRNVAGQALMARTGRSVLVESINKQATKEILTHRDLLRSDLSDEQLNTILSKLIDLKINERIAKKLMPTTHPSLKRSKGRNPVGRPRKRFVVRKQPKLLTTDIETTTDCETTTAFEDSEISD